MLYTKLLNTNITNTSQMSSLYKSTLVDFVNIYINMTGL